MKECKEPQKVMPVVNMAKCEGKDDCLRVCPYDVFEIRKANSVERSELNFFENLKSFFHGHKKAFVVRPEMCHNCGLCVTACPEKAIRLTKFISRKDK